MSQQKTEKPKNDLTDLVGLSIMLLITGIGEIILIGIFSNSATESMVIFSLSLIGIFVVAWVLVIISISLGESWQNQKRVRKKRKKY